MAEFKPAFDRTMKFEDDPRHPGKVTHDAGGRTRFGIADKFHPDLPENFFTIPAEDALSEAEVMMEGGYWDAMRLAEVEDQDVANKLFDMAVNMGTHQAAIYAQRAVNAFIHQAVRASLALVGKETFGTEDDLRPMRAVFPLKEDGKLGPKSLAAINASDPVRYLELLREFSAAHYRHIATNNPAQAVNLEGWLKRAEA